MNVVRTVRECEAAYRALPAVIESGRCWTYEEFYARVDRLSNALIDRDIRKGDVLLCWLPNIREALETELACLQTGVIWVTLNSGLTWPEVERVVRATEPRAVVVHSELAPRIRLDCGETRQIFERAVTIAAGPPGSWLHCSESYENAIENASPVTPDVGISESDTARLRYTSGTTGSAKAAILSHRVYLGSLRNLEEHLHPLDSTDRVLHAAPLTHASAALAYPILAAGGANVILPTFDAERVLETIERERITTMFAVPTMLQRLASCASFRTRDLSSIRTISYGGAAMPVAQLDPLMEKLGASLMQIYGLTEAVHPVTCLRREEHFAGNPKLGSAGTLTSTCEIKIADEGGNGVAPGGVGEIHVRGPITFDGYWRDAEETAKTLIDGWVASGDMGFRDAEGYYWIVDRKKDVIISGGFNVYAKEVEMRLCAHPDVTEAAVVGLASEAWGEEVHAAVRLRPGSDVTGNDLIAWCRESLAGYKTPKGVTFLGCPLPKNSAGKLVKKEIAAMIENEASRGSANR